MKIAICDDSRNDLRAIKGLLAEYTAGNESVRINAEYFTDPAELYGSIQNGERWDIYILDMLMPQKSGVDIGVLLRSANVKSPIIYITSSEDFALEAYGVHAVRYLLKPVEKELFIEALGYAVSCVSVRESPERDEVFLVKTKDGLTAVPYCEIEYIENYSRMLNIHLTNGKSVKSIFIRQSFENEISRVAQKREFFQVHKSFVVNLSRVDRLSPDKLVMESGAFVPVSKTRAAAVKREYLKFVADRYQ